jgi:hypothetical protein
MTDSDSDLPPAVPWNLINKELNALAKFALTKPSSRLALLSVMLRIVWPFPLLLEDQESIYGRLVETDEALAELTRRVARKTEEEWSRALRRLVRFLAAAVLSCIYRWGDELIRLFLQLADP